MALNTVGLELTPLFLSVCLKLTLLFHFHGKAILMVTILITYVNCQQHKLQPLSHCRHCCCAPAFCACFFAVAFDFEFACLAEAEAEGSLVVSLSGCWFRFDVQNSPSSLLPYRHPPFPSPLCPCSFRHTCRLLAADGRVQYRICVMLSSFGHFALFPLMIDDNGE